MSGREKTTEDRRLRCSDRNCPSRGAVIAGNKKFNLRVFVCFTDEELGPGTISGMGTAHSIQLTKASKNAMVVDNQLEACNTSTVQVLQGAECKLTLDKRTTDAMFVAADKKLRQETSAKTVASHTLFADYGWLGKVGEGDKKHVEIQIAQFLRVLADLSNARRTELHRSGAKGQFVPREIDVGSLGKAICLPLVSVVCPAQVGCSQNLHLDQYMTWLDESSEFPGPHEVVQVHHTARHDTTRHDTTRHDTTRHDTTRHDTTRRHYADTTRHDTTRHVSLLFTSLHFSSLHFASLLSTSRDVAHPSSPYCTSLHFTSNRRSFFLFWKRTTNEGRRTAPCCTSASLSDSKNRIWQTQSACSTSNDPSLLSRPGGTLTTAGAAAARSKKTG